MGGGEKIKNCKEDENIVSQRVEEQVKRDRKKRAGSSARPAVPNEDAETGSTTAALEVDSLQEKAKV